MFPTFPNNAQCANKPSMKIANPWTVVTFVVPLSTSQPVASSVPTSNPTSASQTPTPTQFTLHHVPEDQTGAAKEAMMHAFLMMDRLKVGTSQARLHKTPVLRCKPMSE